MPKNFSSLQDRLRNAWPSRVNLQVLTQLPSVFSPCKHAGTTTIPSRSRKTGTETSIQTANITSTPWWTIVKTIKATGLALTITVVLSTKAPRTLAWRSFRSKLCAQSSRMVSPLTKMLPMWSHSWTRTIQTCWSLTWIQKEILHLTKRVITERTASWAFRSSK